MPEQENRGKEASSGKTFGVSGVGSGIIERARPRFIQAHQLLRPGPSDAGEKGRRRQQQLSREKRQRTISLHQDG